MSDLEPVNETSPVATLPPPSASLSDPVGVWGAGPAGRTLVTSAPPRPASTLSVSSSSSSIRRPQEAEQAFARASAERRRQLEEQERQDRLRMEEELRAADARSEAGYLRPIPQGSAAAEQQGVAKRRLHDLLQEAEALSRALGEPSPLRSSVVNPSQPVSSPSPATVADLTSLFGHVKLKVEKPKAWSGQFDHLAREGFIKSMTNYFQSVQIAPSTPIDAVVLGVVRSLFSADTPKSGGVSPQRWYDSQMDRGKFRSLDDVFAAMRAHWLDRGAAERARRAFDKAEQASLKAQEFGALIDSLADECFDRTYSDETRRDRFVMGLRPEIRDFYEVQLAIWQDMHPGMEPPFNKAVELAARSDSLSGRAATLPSAKSHSSLPSPRAQSGTKAALHPTKPTDPTARTSAPKTDQSPPDKWYRDASEFQAQNPMSQKAAWHRPNADPTPTQVKCWNCGKDGFHRSAACPNPRVDLRRVIVAALASLGGSASTPGESGDAGSAGSGGDGSDVTASSVCSEVPGKE